MNCATDGWFQSLWSTRISAPNSREVAADTVKGWLILCVLIGHLPAYIFLGFNPSWWSAVNEGIYLFHVPLFLSFAFVYPSRTLPGLLKSLMGILVPYCVWYGLFQWSLLLQQPGIWLGNLLQGNFASLGSTLWFLPAMASCRLIAFLWNQIPERARASVFSVVAGLWLISFASISGICTMHPSVPFSLDVAIVVMPLGVLVAAVFRKRACVRGGFFGLCVLACAAIHWLYILEPLKTRTQWPKRIDLAQLSCPESLGTYLVWVIVCALVLLAAASASNRILGFIGRYTMPVYLMHYEVYKYFMNHSEGSFLGKGILFTLLVFLAALCVPIALAFMARRLWRGVVLVGL